MKEIAFPLSGSSLRSRAHNLKQYFKLSSPVRFCTISRTVDCFAMGPYPRKYICADLVGPVFSAFGRSPPARILVLFASNSHRRHWRRQRIANERGRTLLRHRSRLSFLDDMRETLLKVAA